MLSSEVLCALPPLSLINPHVLTLNMSQEGWIWGRAGSEPPASRPSVILHPQHWAACTLCWVGRPGSPCQAACPSARGEQSPPLPAVHACGPAGMDVYEHTHGKRHFKKGVSEL